MRSPSASVRPHSTPNARVWQARLGVPMGLLGLTLIYFWPQLIAGQVLYWGDIGLYFTPMQAFLRDNLRQGRLPLWNPLILCGTPYVGNPQTWPLYPVTALLPWLPTSQFLNWTIALHVWLAGVGTYLFARRALALGRGAALLAAVTFMFGGQLVSKEQFPNMVQASAWLPWILWSLDGLLRRRRWRDALGLGVVLGLQLLAAHVQMTLLTLYLAAAYGVFVVVGMRNPPRLTSSPPLPKREGQEVEDTSRTSLSPRETGGRRASANRVGSFRFLLSGMVAAGLAMGQILPTLALFRDAARHRLPFQIVNRFFLPTNELGNFVLPRLHGHPFYGDWAARGNFWETCCYVGWVPFALALCGAVAAWRGRGNAPARFWTVICVLGVWMAMGGSGGLYHLAYWALPGFRAFHDPARCLLWACFALSLLAGYGWEQVTRLKTQAKNPPGSQVRHSPETGAQRGASSETSSTRLGGSTRSEERAQGEGGSLGGSQLVTGWVPALVLILAFADLARFGRTLYPLADPAALNPPSPITAAVQADPDVRAGQARFLAPTPGVWLRFTSYKDFQQNTPEYQRLWTDTLTPNLMMSYGLADAYGYEPVSLQNADAVAGQADHAFDPNTAPGQRAKAAARAGALGVKYVILCRIQPPQTIFPGLLPVRADPSLAPPHQKREQLAFVYLSRNAQWQPRARMEGTDTAVTLQDAGPDQVTLTFNAAAPGRLTLADTAAAGWQATLDGRPVPIDYENGFLRVVTIPQAGAHAVVFSYRPTPFRLGLYLSLLTLAALTACAAYAGTRNIFDREGFARRGVE